MELGAIGTIRKDRIWDIVAQRMGLPKAKRNGRMISNIYSARLMAQPASPLAPRATAAVTQGRVGSARH